MQGWPWAPKGCFVANDDGVGGFEKSYFNKIEGKNQHGSKYRSICLKEEGKLRSVKNIIGRGLFSSRVKIC